MDLLKIPKKQKQFDCKFAAPSILTGRFVAYVYCTDEHEVTNAFNDPGLLIVENEHVGVKEYAGYTSLDSIDEQPDGFIVKMSKDGTDNG